jgi:hypothetical protein
MEWFSLVLWALIASIALPIGLGAIANPMLGLQALAVLGGLAVPVLWAFGIGSEDTAWIAFACAAVGVITASIAGAGRASGYREVSMLGQTGEELLAALVGLEVPLIAVAGLLMLAVAAGGLTFS